MSSSTWGVFEWGRNSPVANRPEDSQFFPPGMEALVPAGRSGGRSAPEGQTQAANYKDYADGSVLEAQMLKVIGRPSMHIYQEDGSGHTVISIRRNISNIGSLTEADLGFADEWARSVLGQLQAFSAGPYTTRDLRKMGHPYGYEESWRKGHAGFKGRKVPGQSAPFGVNLRINSAKGVRGSVPTMAVLNRQSGELQKSWSYDVERDAGGFTIQLRNSQKYSWFLVHGTQVMQPHGPFTYVPLKNLRALDSNLHRMLARARVRARSESAILRLMESVS